MPSPPSRRRVRDALRFEARGSASVSGAVVSSRSNLTNRPRTLDPRIVPLGVLDAELTDTQPASANVGASEAERLASSTRTFAKRLSSPKISRATRLVDAVHYFTSTSCPPCACECPMLSANGIKAPHATAPICARVSFPSPRRLRQRVRRRRVQKRPAAQQQT